jgi:hypothetical protein
MAQGDAGAVNGAVSGDVLAEVEPDDTTQTGEELDDTLGQEAGPWLHLSRTAESPTRSREQSMEGGCHVQARER